MKIRGAKLELTVLVIIILLAISSVIVNNLDVGIFLFFCIIWLMGFLVVHNAEKDMEEEE